MKVEFEAVLEEAISPYHTVKAVTAQLERFGFRRFDAGSGAAPNPGGKYYATRGGKSVAAWVQPAAGAPQDLRLVTAHTDFPALKVKPNSFHTRDNCALIELDVYDGPDVASWGDRELRFGGKLFHKTVSGLAASLVAPEALFGRIVSMAPHLAAKGDASAKTKSLKCVFDVGAVGEGNAFLDALCAGSNVDPEAILELDVFAAPADPVRRFGANRALLSSARLDNLASCAGAIDALSASADQPSRTVRMVSLFDAEEIGSQTWSGALSSFQDEMIEIVLAGGSVSRTALLRGSTHLSLDVAHAAHPSAPEAIDEFNTPRLGEGVAIKYGSRGRYAYSPALAAILFHHAERLEIPVQTFMYPVGHARGGSLGPCVAAKLGVRSMDLGVPIGAMHSVRELCCVDDVAASSRLLQAYFSDEHPINLTEHD